MQQKLLKQNLTKKKCYDENTSRLILILMLFII